MTVFYPDYLRFAGEKYSLTKADWEDFWEKVKELKGRDAAETTYFIKNFLKCKGYLNEN